MIYGCIISVRLQAQVVVQLVLVVCQQVCAFDSLDTFSCLFLGNM
jgi:hypothetical protein